jgi:hypothetical protein
MSGLTGVPWISCSSFSSSYSALVLVVISGFKRASPNAHLLFKISVYPLPLSLITNGFLAKATQMFNSDSGAEK